MATTFTVTSTTDDSSDPTYAQSLRYALSQAQDGDTIVFGSSIAGQTITLGSTLNVTHGVTIDGGTSGVVISHVAASSQNASTYFPDFTVAVSGSTPATIENLAINDASATGAKGAKGATGATGGTGMPGGTGGDGGTGGNIGGGIYVQSGSLVLANDSFKNDHATGGLGGFGGTGGQPGAGSSTKGASGAGGQGGNAAGGVYVEQNATVTASNLTFVADSNGTDTNQGTGGSHGLGNGGSNGQGFNDSNDPAVTCFAGGTLIRTSRGDVAVEDLVVGDLVATTSGAHRPIRWLGHRTIDCPRHPRPHEVRPIEIAAHAFGEGRPARDLRVSPGHSICVDVVGEVLIPAANLVNGATIRQVEVDEVTYWHVELDSHDVLLAENLPAESYLDMGNRGFFHEADVVDLAAGPDADPASRTHADFCRPFHDAGALVEVVKAQLAARAESMGWSLTTALELHLEVDGRRLEPVVRGATVRFHVPAGAREVWLVSPTARPRDTMAATGDSRDLGLSLAALRIDDGVTAPRDVALDDPRLCVGFHAAEDGCRWTAGRALLPAALWEGCEDGFFLRLQLAAGPVPRWEPPAASFRLAALA